MNRFQSFVTTLPLFPCRRTMYFIKKRKHIDTCFHFIRELVKNGDIVLKFCDSKEKLADIFTKPLGKVNFEFQCQKLGIKQCNPQN